MGEGFTGQAAVEPAVKGNELPTFLGALRYSSDWGAVNLAGAVGRADVEGQNVSTHTLHAGAHFNVTDATRLMATLNFTSGMGKIWGGASTVMNAAGKLKAQESMGGFAGISHRWTAWRYRISIPGASCSSSPISRTTAAVPCRPAISD